MVRCIELGAEDYLPKPFNSVLLRARIGASLERKRLHDREARRHLAEIECARRRADELLHAILPAAAVQELRTSDRIAPRRFEGVAVVFGDLVGFTSYCERHPAEAVLAKPRPSGLRPEADRRQSRPGEDQDDRRCVHGDRQSARAAP